MESTGVADWGPIGIGELRVLGQKKKKKIALPGLASVICSVRHKAAARRACAVSEKQTNVILGSKDAATEERLAKVAGDCSHW